MTGQKRAYDGRPKSSRPPLFDGESCATGVHIVDRLNFYSEMSEKYKCLQLTRADYPV
jgi:hypothetical protein